MRHRWKMHQIWQTHFQGFYIFVDFHFAENLLCFMLCILLILRYIMGRYRVTTICILYKYTVIISLIYITRSKKIKNHCYQQPAETNCVFFLLKCELHFLPYHTIWPIKPETKTHMQTFFIYLKNTFCLKVEWPVSFL